jgi:hypothetical protein
MLYGIQIRAHGWPRNRSHGFALEVGEPVSASCNRRPDEGLETQKYSLYHKEHPASCPLRWRLSNDRRCRSTSSGRLMTLLDLSPTDFRRFLTVLTNNVKDLPRSGRPRVTSDRDDRALQRLVRWMPFTTSPVLKQH